VSETSAQARSGGLFAVLGPRTTAENVHPMEEIVRAAHLCVDMQNIFAKGGLWETPWMERVLPTIESIVSRYPERTIFSRFITPQRAEERPGQWQHYFRRWQHATRQNLRGDELELVPAMARYVPPAVVVDKPVYSAFVHSRLYDLLTGKGIRTIVVSGAETDVCVLATVFSAVDLGFRVVIVEDALCSSSDEGHDALMTMYRTRLHEQIDVVEAEELFDVWRPE
jgi:nicotinamidase-related amidase